MRSVRTVRSTGVSPPFRRAAILKVGLGLGLVGLGIGLGLWIGLGLGLGLAAPIRMVHHSTSEW